MAGTVIVRKTTDLLREVYRNVNMASESILSLMPKAKNSEFKEELTVQLSRYQEFSSRAAKLIADEGGEPENEGWMAKISAKWGIMLNTLKDSSTEHLAQMMVEGSTMGVGEMMRWIGEAENSGVSADALALAREVCEFEEACVREMKDWLK